MATTVLYDVRAFGHAGHVPANGTYVGTVHRAGGIGDRPNAEELTSALPHRWRKAFARRAPRGWLGGNPLTMTISGSRGRQVACLVATRREV